ncbi:substrate-binding periplasmic protein [Leeia oryzae]|uniref:substrate-binding periplasmic protein n=1 Tax=Leeia oryzae TaxID=356662 RepID=UPI000378B1E0|nr:transporter substrate-binding domain-containing protein [Leeia oryzae]
MQTVDPHRYRLAPLLGSLCILLFVGLQALGDSLHYYPVGPIYEYRWQLLALALKHTPEGGPTTLLPYQDDASQKRAVSLLQTGAIDVLALGTNQERENEMLPVRIDISRGIVGFRVLIIRAADQQRIKGMDAASFLKLTFGLNAQWADVPIMRANGLNTEVSLGYETLFAMLTAKRFDAFPRGLSEAQIELAQRKAQYPQLVLEQSKALYFPFPIYFWVNKHHPQLASRIETGLKRALADGSFHRLFARYYATEIAALKAHPRQIIFLINPVLPPGNPLPDTNWWWHQPRIR